MNTEHLEDVTHINIQELFHFFFLNFVNYLSSTDPEAMHTFSLNIENHFLLSDFLRHCLVLILLPICASPFDSETLNLSIATHATSSFLLLTSTILKSSTSSDLSKLIVKVTLANLRYFANMLDEIKLTDKSDEARLFHLFLNRFYREEREKEKVRDALSQNVSRDNSIISMSELVGRAILERLSSFF